MAAILARLGPSPVFSAGPDRVGGALPARPVLCFTDAAGLAQSLGNIAMVGARGVAIVGLRAALEPRDMLGPP